MTSQPAGSIAEERLGQIIDRFVAYRTTIEAANTDPRPLAHITGVLAAACASAEDVPDLIAALRATTEAGR